MQKAKRQLEMMAGDDILETEVDLRVYAINQGPPLDWVPGSKSDR